MKKITMCCLFAFLGLSGGMHMQAQGELPPSASKVLFDFAPFEDVKILELFVNAEKAGRKHPTAAEIEAAGLGFDLEFARSHVRPRTVMIDKAKQLKPDLYEKRNLWMNLPTGIGSLIGGYPSATFSDDVYSMWNYTNLFGCWNHGIFQAPGAWADAAHKNGTDIFSGIKFFDTTGGRGQTADAYMGMIKQKNTDGSFKYVNAYINCLMFLGLDGINYNWEAPGYDDAEVIQFHQALYKRAKEVGFSNFHIGMYTFNSSLSEDNVSALYGDTNGKTADVMLNYYGSDFHPNLGNSVRIGENALGNADGVYGSTWIVSMDRTWSRLSNTELAKKCGVCLWGEHGQSRFMSYNAGNNQIEFQSNYQKLLERGFSGGNRNPANLPKMSNTGNNWEYAAAEGNTPAKLPLSSFGGIATYIPERTAIQGKLPFSTYFTLGNGDRYNYKGKKTFGSWYNMGAQDVVPTYRWLVYNAGTTNISKTITPEYTHEDSYMGGSSLQLLGKSTATGTDIILYRAKLDVTAANPKVKVALKPSHVKQGTEPSDLYVILKKFNDAQWKEYAVGDINGSGWQEKEIALTGISMNDQIEYIGFRVKGANDNYDMMVGRLTISDDRYEKPADIKAASLKVEVREETTQSLSVKLNWAVDPISVASRADWNMIYNDEANIDHFEIMYKNGDKGKISEIGRTTTWSGFAGNIMFTGATEEPYIGVRSASIDLKSYSPVQWVKVERSTATNLPTFKINPYCTTGLLDAAEGAEIARAQRYVESFTTTGADQNLAYSANAPQPDGTQYVDATGNSVLKVKQGQTVSLKFKAFDTTNSKWPSENGVLVSKIDGLRWCFAKGYLDLDGSNSFEPDTDELLFDLGTVRKGTPSFETEGYTKEFTIPANAAVGKSRLRVVFSDAWFPHPGPCGYTAKGFSIDFGVEISGTNTSRLPAPDLHDQGEAVEPDRVRDADPTTPPLGVEEVVVNAGFSTFSPNPAEDIIFLKDVEKLWIYTSTGQMVKYVANAPESLNVADLAAGMYIVKMEYNNVIRSQKLYKK